MLDLQVYGTFVIYAEEQGVGGVTYKTRKQQRRESGKWYEVYMYIKWMANVERMN